MHTDRKIGFAMGILLIGIVAALFFRNEPLLSTRVPGVRREKELNLRLRERDVAVYLNDQEPAEPPDQAQREQPWTLRDVLQQMDERNKTAPVPIGSQSIVSNRFDEISDDELDGYRPKRRRTPVESEIVESTSPSRETCPEQIEPDASQFGALPPLMAPDPAIPDIVQLPLPPITESGTSRDKPETASVVNEFVPPKEYVEYVVKYGDTLSGIAQRMLGSQKKYIDIYNANQDRMASPDRLDVGKPLRIPRVAERERSTF